MFKKKKLSFFYFIEILIFLYLNHQNSSTLLLFIYALECYKLYRTITLRPYIFNQKSIVTLLLADFFFCLVIFESKKELKKKKNILKRIFRRCLINQRIESFWNFINAPQFADGSIAFFFLEIFVLNLETM